MRKLFFVALLFVSSALLSQENAWIRVNLLGYFPSGSKVAVWGTQGGSPGAGFELVDASTGKTVFSATAGRLFGEYGPFTQTCRLDFTRFKQPGRYFLRMGAAQSPSFTIGDDVYKGSADFCLRYMRQQRSGFNPFLNDSCHTHDGYTLYGPMPDSTHIDVVGGWHDASDYLQYSTTSANATWHLLAAYRDFPSVFTDRKQANGLDGANGTADVLDEARWGLDWLFKMNPRKDWMFNQLGDDRDHMGMRIPKEDNFYGKGFERPVYFVSGQPQQRGKFMNASTGVSSTAAKFASAFALAASLYRNSNAPYAAQLQDKARAALEFAESKPGVSQTASVRSPYIYAEDNWVDDMELAEASVYRLNKDSSLLNAAYRYAQQEPVTPWLGADTAKHYQWYPFINLGHYEAAKLMRGTARDSLVAFYRRGIERVWKKAGTNAFYRGIPFIWCSNNLTAAFAIQCYWYQQLTGSHVFDELQQANLDWLFGCNPWGTSMVYGLPADGDTPVDPHSAFTHLKHYPIDGGLVDGPVYTSIYKGLIGIHLTDEDEYARFQSGLAVYHDDYGDYSTNEPTMDGTASLIYLLASKESEGLKGSAHTVSHGVAIRGDRKKKEIALVFTGDEFGDGLNSIANTLQKNKVPGSFFFTGRFYRNPAFRAGIRKLYAGHNLLGSHSDMHLLYCDWTKRDSTLVSRDSLLRDLAASRRAIRDAGIAANDISPWFIPPYEWWNDSTAGWLRQAGARTVCFTPGTTSNADYTYPEMGKSYRTSDAILASVKKFEQDDPDGLNGVVLLVHAGTDPRRTDKLYGRLDELIAWVRGRGYQFKRVDELMK